MDEIANMLLGKLPDPEKKDVVSFIEKIIKERSKL